MLKLSKFYKCLFLGMNYNRVPIKGDEINYFYPEAKEWMWNNCIPLGKYVTQLGGQYDLGVREWEAGPPSFAIVYSESDGDYMSGRFPPERDQVFCSEVEKETIRRYNIWKRRYRS